MLTNDPQGPYRRHPRTSERLGLALWIATGIALGYHILQAILAAIG